MVEFKKEDLDLSESFKKKTEEFESFNQSLNNRIRKKTSDTAEAILFFNSYKEIYKERTKSLSIRDRYYFIKNDLIDSFPNLHKNKLTILLIRNGILPFRIFPWIGLLFFNIILCGILSTLGVPQTLYVVACTLVNLSIGSVIKKW